MERPNAMAGDENRRNEGKLTTAVDTLNGSTTGQLLAEVLKRSAGDVSTRRLPAGITEVGEARRPLPINQDLPPKLRKRILRLLNDLDTRDFSMAFLNLAQLHRSLSGPKPEPIAHPEGASAAAAFDHNWADEEDWQRFFA